MAKTATKKKKQLARTGNKRPPKKAARAVKAASPIAGKNSAAPAQKPAGQKSSAKKGLQDKQLTDVPSLAQVLVFLFTVLCVIFAATAFYDYI